MTGVGAAGGRRTAPTPKQTHTKGITLMALKPSQRAAMTPAQIALARSVPKLKCKALTTVEDEESSTNLVEGKDIVLDSGVARVLAKQGLVKVYEPGEDTEGAKIQEPKKTKHVHFPGKG